MQPELNEHILAGMGCPTAVRNFSEESDTTMSIRLAAPRFSRKRLSTSQVLRLRKEAANDNHGGAIDCDAAFRQALELFCQHGLSAARVAYGAAESAASRGDVDGFTIWRDVCANLDRRLAHDLTRFVPQTLLPA